MMDEPKDILILKITAGVRTYFLDVKETREGSRYLKISESKRLKNGEYEKHKIMVFEDHIRDFAEAFTEAMMLFPAISQAEFNDKIRQTKEQFHNAYKPWTQEEDEQLMRLVRAGKNAKDISAIMERNPGAIHSRIEKLHLKE